MYQLIQGDCLDAMRTLPDCSVDSVVTDPPYGLSSQDQDDITACLMAWLAGEQYTHGKSGFMGKAWDAFVPGPEVWREVYRVLKPGGYALVFAGTRTSDLMSIALRLAGFKLVDTAMYCFGSGFPKSANIGKQLDRMEYTRREKAIRQALAEKGFTDVVWSIDHE